MAEATGSSGLVDIKIEIKEEPVFVEASTAESEELDNTDDPLKEEIKDEEEVDVDLLKDEIIVGEPSCSSEEASRLQTGALSGHEPSISSAGSENDKISVKEEEALWKNVNESSETTRIHKCKVCNKIFASPSHLTAHNVVHSGMKTQQCETCGKCFASKALLRQHVFIHKDLKPYKCVTCGKSFNHISNLRTHFLIHEGAKNHKCYICGKAFIQAHCLRRHMAIHDVVKNVECEICGKSVKTSSFKRHTLTHSETYLCKCKICGKSMKQSTYKKHVLLHKQVKTVKCEKCGKFLSCLKTGDQCCDGSALAKI